jgi:very-long-chain (3R)-3-hydroxyacyl-CoA dehydratase
MDSFVKLYLVLYNALLLLGWAGVMAGLVFAKSKDVTSIQLTDDEHSTVMYLELFALLEIVNSLAGLVRGSAVSSLLLHVGRLTVIFYGVPFASREWVVAALYFVFALGEIIRYPMYLLQVLEVSPGRALVWLRYTATLCLLPFGFMFELWTLFDATKAVGDVSKAANQFEGIPKLYLYYAYMVFAYLIGAPQLVGTMYAARKKKLNPRSSKSSKQQ